MLNVGATANGGGFAADDFDNNYFYGPSLSDPWAWVGSNETTFANWQTNSSQDSNSSEGNPTLIDTANDVFALGTGSAAIDTGISLGYTKDFFGNTRDIGVSPDPGAIESGRPVISITNIDAGSTMTSATSGSFTVSGYCSDSTNLVYFFGDSRGIVACNANAWTATLDLSSLPVGLVNLGVGHVGGVNFTVVKYQFVKIP